ncbi:MAG: methylmalonyl Co-A mutase-associated GTPase MeaB [Candidatus Marinimicrobia bacterium]|nr:methylmalonyl Co-A mutase-associated GTPase MeaB [Candidatus Neomarinimicrobiota bacterium]
MVIQNILSGIKSKKIKYIAQAISLIDNNTNEGQLLINQIEDLSSHHSYKIGITGPPGAGKSSITNQLIKKFKEQNKSIGVLLVDPTSPYSNGSILGDRIRMNNYGSDVFIRSLATRGSKGGLSENIDDISKILDYAGFDIVIFETVGVGQVELDVVEVVDTVVVTLVPESGDDIQMMKAGLIEIADVYVINKSDRKDAEKLNLYLDNMLSIIDKDKWKPDIVKTIATIGEGIDQLIEIVYNHKKHLINNNILDFKNKKKYIRVVKRKVDTKLKNEFWNKNRIALLESESSKPLKKRSSISDLIKKIESDD